MNLRFGLVAIALFVSFISCWPAKAQIIPSPPTPSADTSEVEIFPGRSAPESENSTTPSPIIHVAPKPDSSVKGVVRRPFHAWLALSLVGQAAVLADAKTTLDLRRSYPLTFRESDPLARPFVNLPTSAYIGSTIALTAALSAVSWKLTSSEHGWLRRHWWLPQATQIILNAQCSVHNAHQ